MQGKGFPLNQTWKKNRKRLSSRERHRILAAILDFAEEAEKNAKKKKSGKFLKANKHTANI